jgi:Tol biopolymer transport system component
LRNPYITDRPLGDRDHFFGRESALVSLTQMWQSDQRLYLLYGKQHIGKTSLLNQLGIRFGPRHAVHRIDWSESAGTVSDVVSRVILAVARALGWPEPQLTGGRDQIPYLASYLEQNRAILGADRPVICVDGLGLEECGPASDWPRTLEDLNRLLHGGPVAVVISVEARPEECATDGAALSPLVLGGLSQQETEDLLLVPARGQLTYDLDSMRRIYALTGGEPYLVQIYGSILFEERVQRGWVGLIETDQAIDAVIERAAPQFVEMWGRCSVRARVVLCVFAEGIGTHGIASADDIRRRLERERVDMPLGDVEQAIDELRQRDMVERLGGGMYRFRSAMFLRWLRNNKTLADTVRRSREYRRRPHPTVHPLMNRRVDWVGLSLWVAITVLVVAIGSVWRSRETRILWTNAPPTETPRLDGNIPVVLPTPERDVLPGEIAYMAKAEAGHYWDIYVMRADGQESVRLTQDMSDNSLPVWSPNGQFLAFVSDRDGNREIYRMNADGTNPVNLTQDPAEDWTPTWSPDGTQLAFASFRDGNWEIYTMNADGTSQTRITDNGTADYSPVWSPKGDSIAFVSDRAGQLDIYLMAPDGSDVRALTTDPASDQSPAWSHDGTQILWESYRNGNMEIFAMDAAGGQPRNLTQDAYADDHGGTWSPSGRRIAFFSNRNGGWDIYTLDLQTGERVNLTASQGIEQYPAFRP